MFASWSSLEHPAAWTANAIGCLACVIAVGLAVAGHIVAILRYPELRNSIVDMARFRFGVGDYKYFAAPLPPVPNCSRTAR